MNYTRFLLTLLAGVLLIGAVTMIDTQHIVWTPSGPVRLALGGVGLLLALASLLIGRPERHPADGNEPPA
jgi:hypothetical protein